MKRFLFFIAILSLMMGCKKTLYVAKFDETPQERAGDQIALVSSSLSASTNGWVVTMPTLAGGGYGFYMSFDGNQNVTMYGDMTAITSSTSKKSYYRVKQDLGTDLVFDTYTYISMLDDPNAAVLGGATKIGYSSDVEFIYDRMNGDSLIFKGKKYRQPFIMVKATAAQKSSYEAAGLKAAIDKFNNFFIANKNAYIDVVTSSGTTKVAIVPNSTNVLATGKRVFFVTSPPADTFVSDEATGEKFAFTLDGIAILNNGLLYKGITFVKFAWKDANTLAVYDSKGKEYIINNTTSPAVYTSVTLPDATTAPGWGTDFVTRRAQAAATTLAAGNNIKIGKFKFTFTASTRKMDLNISISISGNANYTDGIFTYTYFKNTDGTFKFSGPALSGNASFLSIDQLTTQRINVDKFKLTYYTDPVSGTVLGRFTSIEHPDFSFAGTLL